ncbi:3-hydroxyacyl-CoA dehydrogenase NAD-binding domain-containing protein [Taklimakanibacter deserti]|uniref:3-hydroxyacyl-CoA dehydrogenase NAD-binding domain-containing protein n=1 Tax=Taklimakanibacter deserti TaxID=2267839 RepID=UPI000E64A4C2
MTAATDITRRPVGVVGFGIIGQRWAAAFIHAGLTVRAYDPDEGQWQRFAEVQPALLADLDALHGPASRNGTMIFSTNMAEALAGTGFIQENGPERLELKQELLREIERHVADDCIIASSSSALSVSEMQSRCVRPERVVLGHPFNPAHLMPLVEIVGGAKTQAQTVAVARAFYDSIGKKPVVLNREITGHLALRLMGAMWREAIALARDGVASIADIDRAFMYGPGPKWTLQGSFISNHLNAEGIEAFFRKYGGTYQDIWDDLGVANLNDETAAAVAASMQSAVKGRSHAQLRAERDEGLIDILKALNRHGAL